MYIFLKIILSKDDTLKEKYNENIPKGNLLARLY